MSRTYFVLVFAGLIAAETPIRADQDADTKAILDKVIKALGGEENIAKYKAASWKAKGQLHFGKQPLEFTGEFFAQPGKQQLKTHFTYDVSGMLFSRYEAINGDSGWIRAKGKVTDMPPAQIAQNKETLYDGWVAAVLPLKDPAFTLTPVGDVKVGDRLAVGLKVARKDQKDVNIYFDKETWLPVKVSKRVKDLTTGGQEIEQETIYSDYQHFGDVQHYKKFVVKRDGKPLIEMEITEFKPEEKLDDSVFKKPD
jgi:hypothetical protein